MFVAPRSSSEFPIFAARATLRESGNPPLGARSSQGVIFQQGRALTYIADSKTADMSQEGCVWDEGGDKEENSEGCSPCRDFECAYARERLLASSPHVS